MGYQNGHVTDDVTVNGHVAPNDAVRHYGRLFQRQFGFLSINKTP